MSLFICLEGIDGTGKTTVARVLARQLNAMYYKSPGGVFAKTRHIVDGDGIDPLTRYFYYRAATQYDSQMIRQILKHSSVVCDRYIYSTIAYHSAMDTRIEGLKDITGLVIPDYTFLLTANEEVRLERLSNRPTVSNLEENSLLQRKADQLFMTQGHIVIQTSVIPVHEVVGQILRHLQQRRSL